jgi:transcriptional regulator
MPRKKTDLLQGTLDLLILKTLASGDLHGWGIARQIQRKSSDVLTVNQGSLYPALQRLEQRKLIESRWGKASGKRAKLYSLTDRGRKQLAEERESWRAFSLAMKHVLEG